MPFYDLSCALCGGEFNIRASMAEKSEKKIACPECGSLDLKTIYKGAPAAYIKSPKGAARECPNRNNNSNICGMGNGRCRNA
jgi:putative FmdB family regulatory protein